MLVEETDEHDEDLLESVLLRLLFCKSSSSFGWTSGNG